MASSTLSIPEFTDRLQNIANKTNFDLKIHSSKNVIELIFYPKCHFYINFFITLFKNESQVYLEYSVRTSSWDFSGERTDLHDVLSQLFAAWVRIKPNMFSGSIWDMSNPAAPLPGEIYARKIISEHPTYLYPIDNSLYTLIESCLETIHEFEFIFNNCFEFNYKNKNKIEYIAMHNNYIWLNKINLKSVFGLCKVSLINKRFSPYWTYCRWISKKYLFSIIKAKNLGSKLYVLFSEIINKEIISINSTNGILFISKSNQVGNFIPYKIIDKINSLFCAIDKRSRGAFCFIPINNSIIALNKDILIFFEYAFNYNEFNIEKKLLENKIKRTNRLLFNKHQFYINKSIDDENFEKLCYDLLSREGYVLWIRRVGISRDRDAGSDLICQIITTPINRNEIKEGSTNEVRRTIVVQCKTSKNGISKSKVTDIRDTIEYYKADGFLLICNNHITSSLAQHLLDFKNTQRYWIDWWTSLEIESKIALYPDLQDKYKDIFNKIH